MLKFTDLHHTKHIINTANLNNVQLSEKNGCLVMSFHMIGPHTVPVSIDKTTATRIMDELGGAK